MIFLRLLHHTGRDWATEKKDETNFSGGDGGGGWAKEDRIDSKLLSE